LDRQECTLPTSKCGVKNHNKGIIILIWTNSICGEKKQLKDKIFKYEMHLYIHAITPYKIYSNEYSLS
jgi:hypothetical protein